MEEHGDFAANPAGRSPYAASNVAATAFAALFRELIPSRAYGERLLRIAHEILAPGGLALVQIKCDTGSWPTRPRRLSYRFSPGNTTTCPIHTFWELAARCGFEPRYVELVPQDELDERYAYFVLVKSAAPDGTS